MSDTPNLRQDFGHAARSFEGAPGPSQDYSKQRLAELAKQLSTLAPALELTPPGTAIGELRSARDQEIARQMKAIQERLAQRRTLARDDFNRGTDGTGIGH